MKRPALRARLIAAGVVCGLCELSALIVYTIHFAKWGWQDWMVYYGAARAYLDNGFVLLLDAHRFTAYLNATFSAWLPEPFSFRSWVYPPPFLLLLLPFAMLPFAASCLLFQGATLGAALAAVWHFAGRGRRTLQTLALVFSPPAAFNFGTGQNGFLTAALLVGGFGVLERHPIAAGVLLGSLTYKPQFAPLAMLALLAGGQRRALAAAIATAALLAFASLAIFGSDSWRFWLEWVIRPPPGEYQSFAKCCLLHDESVATNFAMLGASPAFALAMQLIAAAAAGACVWWCYRRPMPRPLQLAVLLAATTLAAPHFANYDAVLLVVAASLIFADGYDNGFRRGGLIIPVAVWVMQLFNPPDAFRIGVITPVVTALLIACAFRLANHPVGGSSPIRRAAAGSTPT